MKTHATIPIGLTALALVCGARVHGATAAVTSGSNLASGGAARTMSAVCPVSPEVVPLRPTQSAPGSRGTLTLTQPGSPFEITVDPGGVQTFDIAVQVDRLRRRRGATYVVWAAKPDLDEYVQLGVLGDGNRLEGRVAWNQFMVFVSEEATADVERWQGPIVLTGLSPSGRLHTMAGHGPFEDVSCQQYY